MKIRFHHLVISMLALPAGLFNVQAQEFSLDDFRQPSATYAPFTRWWWPGGDVEPEELRRELQMFADHNFGGVEIQAFALVIPPPMESMGKIMSFDTPSYYESLSVVMEEAERLGLTVDLTHGSGWPASGSHITETEENRSLQFGMTDIPAAGGKVMVPRPERQDSEFSTLVALLEAQITEPADSPRKIMDVSVLGSLSTDAVEFKSAKTEDGARRVLISLWSVPSQETNMIVAKPGAGNVLDHLDSNVVVKSYEHYFGAETGLDRYYGRPFRSIFNDSYEFKVDRHFTADFIETFRSRRGYDPTPWLPANIWFGYNNMYDNEYDRPEFAFSEEDWRLRYDYDLTVSDLIRTHLLKGSADWAEKRGLMHKTQPYGLPLDYMRAAADASIPEVENMLFDGGSEGGIKMITSGAMLYDKPVVSSESGVHINRGLMMTPQKLRLTVDKLLSSGVNQIIWHGTPYKYTAGGKPWQPFYNSMIGTDFSSDLYEENVFWEEVADVNAYAQRAQYLMRCGKADADVLVYYPFLEYPVDVANPEEILYFGYLPETEPYLVGREVSEKMHSKWVQSIWPVLNSIEKKGLTWAWVNDESLQQMTTGADGTICIRGREYSGLVLYDLPYIQKETAQHLSRQKNAEILILGSLPEKQPSFLNHERNDRMTASMMRKVARGSNICTSLEDWNPAGPVRIIAGGDGIRQCRRVMPDGDLIQMFWNPHDSWKSFELAADAGYSYWLDAEDGSVRKALLRENGVVSVTLAPQTSRFLYLSENFVPDAAEPFEPSEGEVFICLDKWDVAAGEIVIEDMVLTDWREVEALADSADEALYTTSFTFDGKEGSYVLDLGDVYYTAEVALNGRPAGTRSFGPFRFDVTDMLVSGENTVTVKVKVSEYNSKAKLGSEGDAYYSSLVGKGRMANGLSGPVTIRRVE